MQPEPAPPLEGARQDYESLRRSALNGGSGPRELGLALLMRQGMAAWIRAWSACASVPRPTRSPIGGESLTLPEGVRGDVTQLLVTMALGASRREARP